MLLAVALVLTSSAGPDTVLVSGTASNAIPSRLSLAEAERIFLERGLDLLIAESQAAGAEGDLKAAAAHPNPNLSLGTLYTAPASSDVIYPHLGSNAPVTLWGLSAGLSDNAAIEDQLSGKRSLRIQAASQALLASRLGIEEVKRQELSQIRQAYAAAVMAGLNLDAAQESLRTYDQQLTLNQTRFKEGAIGKLDLFRVSQAELEALQAVDQARSGQAQALASLMFLLGVRDSAPAVTLTSGIDYAQIQSLAGSSLSSLHQLALGNRTDVRVATANLEQARVVLRQAKRQRLPDISLSAGYSEQCSGDSCSSEPSYNLGLSGNLPLLYHQQGEIRRAAANVSVAERSLDKTRAQVLSDVTQAWSGYLAEKSQLERMEGDLLKQAKASRDLAQAMYQKGAASLIDFLDAQRTYVATELEYHQDLANYWASVYQLEQATATALRSEADR